MDPRICRRVTRTTVIVQLDVIRRHVDLIQTEILGKALSSVDHIDLVMREAGSLTDEIPHIGDRVDPLHRSFQNDCPLDHYPIVERESLPLVC